MSITGICQHSLAAVKAEPSHQSELVTQLLFGECYEVISADLGGDWLRVRTAFEGYEGWVHTQQHAPYPAREYKFLTTHTPTFVADPVACLRSGDRCFPVVAGSILPFYDAGKAKVGDQTFYYAGQVQRAEAPGTWDVLSQTALSYLKAPYLWGGRSHFGIDCSGFTQQIFRRCGYTLPRDAWQQTACGTLVETCALAQPGDLAFFHNDAGRVTHVGVVWTEGMILHAHGEVRFDRLEETGLYHLERRRVTHKLNSVKRILRV
ncbi:SH3 domain-containing protein [Catalinimonas alkaloidigena]|uniref:SH3 domain-containing protein n=1 Tax=Catalinimonas alkaloidigena TaxID=1075417 RepID=A0A1G9UQE4_9BACT|nr:NlpC/P60 family protein [Catalinimonas alkaloidigena]SDM62172.1 SH3 domain-containing protein [Catalinimonas alkaloidigena]